MVGLRWSELGAVVLRAMPFNFAVGFTVAVPGPALEAVRNDFALPYVLASLTLMAPGVGYMVGTLVGGVLADRIGRRAALTTAAVVVVGGLGISGVAPSLGVLMVGSMLGGLGFGMADPAVLAAIGDAAGDRTGRALMFAHIPFGLGALAAPPLVAALLLGPIGWRGGYLAAALSFAAAMALLLSARIPAAAAPLTPRVRLSEAVMRPVPILLGAVISLYMGAQVVMTGFLAAYLESGHGFARASASAAVTAFWGGVSIGRLIAALPLLRMRLYEVALASLGLTALCSLAVVAAPSPVVVLVSVVLVGLVIGPTYTMLVGIGVLYRPAVSGVVSGFILAIGGTGYPVFSLLSGVMADAWSVRMALGLFPASMAIAMLILLAARRFHRMEAAAV